MRLDKLLSQRADMSRAQARAAIRKGRVTLNGKALATADTQVAEDAPLCLDGQPLGGQSQRHVMLNKPLGVLTAARDAQAATVMDLLPAQFARIKCMPVGRLDKDSEGLLLLTTDGELAHRLLAPRRGVVKVYEALVAGRLDEQDAAAFRAGIVLTDFTALPATLSILQASDEESLALVELSEGKHRQVRRMLGSLGHEVRALKRLRFGPLTLDASLQPGEYRDLTSIELQWLKEAAGLV